MMLKKISDTEFHTNCTFAAACCSLFGCDVTADLNIETEGRLYKTTGDVMSAIKKIAQNESLGALSLGQEITRLRELSISRETEKEKE